MTDHVRLYESGQVLFENDHLVIKITEILHRTLIWGGIGVRGVRLMIIVYIPRPDSQELLGSHTVSLGEAKEYIAQLIRNHM